MAYEFYQIFMKPVSKLYCNLKTKTRKKNRKITILSIIYSYLCQNNILTSSGLP